MHQQLQALADPDSGAILTGIRRGIEKESLRISSDGKLAQTPHPRGLGSALTHPSITTDYSEALLEFITPVSTDIEQSLQTLEDVHRFVYQQLDGEMLWAASMPCIVAGDAGIPVAQYGSSNVARMKTVYRYGLGHRYGRMMQAIAGIHYNFSMPEAYWERTWREAGSPGDSTDYISERYLGLIRNFRRYSWLLIYLFGASPAVCSTFLRGRDNHGLQAFDARGRSLGQPWGTALRMGDLGYSSDAQKGLNICYNSLDNYIETLRQAIMQPHPGYSDIPSGQDGEYQQLTDSLLQIENEFYSPIRPKRVARKGETPLNALDRAGIEYIEVRCVDVSPFTPLGLDAPQVRFLDTFLLACLLQDSPACDDEEQAMQAANLEAVVNRGRQPGLQLRNCNGQVPLRDWAMELLEAMSAVAGLLDQAHGGDAYTTSLRDQVAKVDDPELTPSARILREMREQDLPFFRLAMGYSERWAEYFREHPPSPEVQANFDRETRESLQAQRDIEESEGISFEQHLDNFFSQYKALQTGAG
jgi:glutamate--cysteine ligase